MAYRFVLEVPEPLADEVQAIISEAPEADVAEVRLATPLAAAEARTEIAVEADSLGVVDQLYDWLREQPASGRVELDAFGGQRVRPSDYSPAQVKALLQGDRHWMEATEAARALSPITFSPEAVLQPYGLTLPAAGPATHAARTLEYAAPQQVTVYVPNIQKAEAFYHEFFEMDIVLRARRVDARWEALAPDFDWQTAIQTGTMPGIVYLEHEPLALLLISVGRGTIFREPRVEHIGLRVMPRTMATLRAQALVRSFTILEDLPDLFVFRDPFGIAWHITADDAA